MVRKKETPKFQINRINKAKAKSKRKEKN